MTEEEILTKAITDGEDAQRLLNHPKIQGFLIEMKGDLMMKFGQTEASQSDVRDEIWRMTKVIDLFEGMLNQYMENGRFAKNELEENYPSQTEGDEEE